MVPSCYRKYFVPDKVKPDQFGPLPVKKERARRLDDVPAQLLPGIPLRKDVLRQAFGAITAIGLLDNLKTNSAIRP